MIKDNLTEKEQYYKEIVSKIRKLDKLHASWPTEHAPYPTMSISNKSTISITAFGLFATITLFVIALLLIPKTLINILLLIGLFFLFSSLLITTLIKNIKEHNFVCKYEKKVADSYKLSNSTDENGNTLFIIEFSVESAIFEKTNYKRIVSEELYNRAQYLHYLPIVLELGNNLYEYDIDYKKIYKLSKDK